MGAAMALESVIDRLQSIIKGYFQSEMYANYSGPSDFDKRRETYAKCKELCLQNGYEGKAFEDLWNKACFEHYSISKHFLYIRKGEAKC